MKTIKNILSLIFVCLSLISCAYSTNLPSLRNAPPVFKCTSAAAGCTFSNVVLNSTNYLWTPTADNPLLVGTVQFTSCVIPVFTNGICNAFPALNVLYAYSIGIAQIAEGAFQNCSALTNLYLYSNQLKTLAPDTFMGLTNLHVLQMNDNQFVKFDDNLFANLHQMWALFVHRNNLTEFSADLLKNNSQISRLDVFSNNLGDLEVEQLLIYLPKLATLYWGDNEVSCMRAVDANNLLISKGITFNWTNTFKIRYYPHNKLFGTQQCNPDISWMASTFRKENWSARQRIDKIEALMEQLVTMVTQLDTTK